MVAFQPVSTYGVQYDNLALGQSSDQSQAPASRPGRGTCITQATIGCLRFGPTTKIAQIRRVLASLIGQRVTTDLLLRMVAQLTWSALLLEQPRGTRTNSLPFHFTASAYLLLNSQKYLLPIF